MKISKDARRIIGVRKDGMQAGPQQQGPARTRGQKL